MKPDYETELEKAVAQLNSAYAFLCAAVGHDLPEVKNINLN